jgi:small-conductance mechanosensitive channel
LQQCPREQVVNAYDNTIAFTDQFLLKHEFYKRMEVRFRAEGIEMPYPHRVLLQRS